MTRKLATKPQTVINVLACRLVFSRLIVFLFSRNTITFQKYFWCSRFSRFDCKLAWDQAPHCGEKGKKIGFGEKKKSRLACFARRCFSYLTPFFAFFPQCGAWSQANCNPKSFFTIRSQKHLLLTPSTSKASKAG